MLNKGHVTSTLLSILRLVKIAQNGNRGWKFKYIFAKDSLSMYVPSIVNFI